MGNMLAYYDMYPGDIMVKHGDQDFKKESSFTDKITSGFYYIFCKVLDIFLVLIDGKLIIPNTLILQFTKAMVLY